MEEVALLGRENEYNEVHSYIEERLQFEHCKSLFVFGACGCGKTTTILRAMRRVTHRPMACDKAVGRASGGGKRSGSSGGDSPPVPAKRTKTGKRRRESDSGDENTGDTASNGRQSACLVEASSNVDAAASLTHLFGKSRRVQCHYVNCADMSSQQLCDTIVTSFRTAQPRLDALTRALLSAIEALPQHMTSSRRRENDGDAAQQALLMQSQLDGVRDAAAPVTSAAARTPLHVLALDEVEYVRAGARGVLTALAALSVDRASQLALVFISNQRDLVHVPCTLLKELPFKPYTAEVLERIGATIVANAEFTRKEREQVQLSPGLMTYIAKRAIQEHSGDVRQVASMCRRLVHTAQQEAEVSADENDAPRSDITPRRHSTRSAAGGAPGSASPSSPAAVVTLAKSQKVLRGPAEVSNRVFEYVGGMPEQMLYVLSCLVVLTKRQQRDKELAQMSVSGVLPAPRRRKTESASTAPPPYIAAGAPTSEPGTFAMRVVHCLYTTLMGQQRFPSMNAAGISSAIDGFADIGIISRPQRRGNEEIFSFNGVWSIESMQAALTARGEALRQEHIDCGLDGSENRFAEVLRELQGIVGL